MAETTAHTEVPAEAHAEPAVLGVVTAPVVVALCVFFVILFLIWKKVPAAVGRSLDKKIEAIREQNYVFRPSSREQWLTMFGR